MPVEIAATGVCMPAGKIVAVGGEGQVDRLVVERAMEGVGVEIAGAFVQHAREHRAAPRLPAASCASPLQRKLQGDKRHGIILDEPGFDARLPS